MWTRSLLKKNAWDNLKGYYWPALGVTVVAGILGANGGGGGYGGGGGGSYNNYSQSSGSSSGSGSDIPPEVLIGIMVGVIALTLVISAIASVYVFFVGMPARCGECKYFVTARNGDQNFGHLFDNFKGGNYMPTVKSMFFYWGEIFLWSLLFLIPGIIKAYEFVLVPYLIAENPRMDIKRAKAISRQTMDGEKFNYWVLQISFIGWYLLGCLACGLGVMFVQPYVEATNAEFYMCMRAKMLSFGYASEDELTGGFPNGMSGSDPTNPGSFSQYNEQNFRNNAYTVPNNSYQNTGYQNNGYQNNGYQNPNDQYNGNMPGVDLTKPGDSNNNNNNPYNQ